MVFKTIGWFVAQINHKSMMMVQLAEIAETVGMAEMSIQNLKLTKAIIRMILNGMSLINSMKGKGMLYLD